MSLFRVWLLILCILESILYVFREEYDTELKVILPHISRIGLKESTPGKILLFLSF